jgi:hypothetical protein
MKQEIEKLIKKILLGFTIIETAILTISLILIAIGQQRVDVPILTVPTPGSKQISKPEEEIDISDWKIYRNEKYTYEIKYPKNWKVNEGEFEGVPYAIFSHETQTPGEPFEINIKKQTIEEFIDEYNLKGGGIAKILYKSLVSEIIPRQKEINLIGNTDEGGYDLYFNLTERDGLLYIEMYNGFYPVHVLMLSTFKFI